MELNGERTISASVPDTWAALNDPETLKACVAGFGKGSADVALAAIDPITTRLAYQARATVGGKMAQIGSRLIDATAAKITDDFFAAFEAQLLARAPASVRAAAAAVATPPRVREPAGALGWALAAIVVVVTLAMIAR